MPRSVSERGERDDEVDLLIDAWSHRLPGVDLTPLDVMSRLRRVANRLGRLRASAFSGAGLAVWEFDVLAALRRAEPPHEFSPAQLIEATMIGSAAMTNRLDNLSRRGLVERRPNPRDGRSVLVRITDEGATRVDEAMRMLAEREAEELRGLSREEQATLAALLRRLGQDAE
ncbi:MarR family transcriptional regulator [Agromyces sp. Root81]|nr:MarR family transcriptional regulator [Agromyces sp. Root81]